MSKAKRALRALARKLDQMTDDWEPVERVLSEAVEEELLLHPGRWVTMTYDRIIAVGDSSTEVYEAARAAGEECPILYYVPNTSGGWYYPVFA